MYLVCQNGSGDANDVCVNTQCDYVNMTVYLVCQNGSGDANDVWLVEIVGEDQGVPVQTVRSQLRLVHYYVRCSLFSHDKKLPKW